MKTAKRAKSSQPKFENRVRFNWGFHDATYAVANGLNTVEKNYGFGFGKGGSTLDINSPDEVVAKHFDKEYAIGWTFGYYEAVGRGSRPESSESAWQSAVREGKVSE